MKIALSGKSGSGKTTVADYLIENHHYSVCSTGRICRQVCKLLFGDESKKTLNIVTDAMKAIEPNVWLNAAIAQSSEIDLVVFDSMRFIEDYKLLKDKGFILIRIETSKELIQSRLNHRGQVFDKDIDFQHRTETELDNECFDHTIDNNASIESLYRKIDAVLLAYHQNM